MAMAKAPDWRDLAYRYAELPYSVRLAIATKLGVVDDDRIGSEVSEVVLFQGILKRIHEEKKADEFERLIDERTKPQT